MKTTIYYFSATGNSLHVAQMIAGNLDECELISIPALRHDRNIVADTELVGFVFPMHYFGLPPIVRQFFEKVDMEQVKYSFAVVTSGSSRHLSSTLQQADTLLEQKGKKLDAGFHVGMISSYIPLSDLPPTEKMHQKLAKADEKVQAIVNAVRAKQRIRESEPLWMPFAAINHYWRKNLLMQAHRKFSCKPSCTSCSICEQVCPVGNIKLIDGKPQWANHCQECLACLHFCPVQSIEFGGRTAGRKRYHHPKVAAGDIIQSRKAAPEGKD